MHVVVVDRIKKECHHPSLREKYVRIAFNDRYLKLINTYELLLATHETSKLLSCFNYFDKFSFFI